jgi:hypothetical protein
VAQWPDKVKVNAYYDERNGACHSIDVILNYDGITSRDVAETIQALYTTGAPLPADTRRNRELGSTEVVPRVRVNGEPVEGRARTITPLNGVLRQPQTP